MHCVQESVSTLGLPFLALQLRIVLFELTSVWQLSLLFRFLVRDFQDVRASACGGIAKGGQDRSNDQPEGVGGKKIK